MGRIQSSIGLITGTPIADTVDQLIALSGQGRDRLVARTKQIQNQQIAIGELTALVIGVQIAGKRLATTDLFSARKPTSSNATALSVVKNGTPQDGSYQVRTLQRAQTHAITSRSLAVDPAAALGWSGAISVRTGGFLDHSASLQELNGGRGVQRGSIRIVDRSGGVAEVDLQDAQTTEDVVRAINDASSVRVRATVDGDRFVLQDLSGSTTGNLRVEEVGGGQTAADLGLRGIDVAASTATGFDVYRLSPKTTLASLRDGRGIAMADGDEMAVQFRDGTTATVDFGDFSQAAGNARGTTAPVDPNAVLTISAAGTGGGADGVRVRFVDDAAVTAGGETVELLEHSGGRELVFHIEAGQSTAAQVAAALAADAELSSQFTAAAGGDGSAAVGVDDTATLSGGAAIAAPAEPTIDDLLRVLNDAAPDRLAARISTDGDRIELLDLTAGGGSFVVSDADDSTAASDLGLAGTAAADVLSGSRLRAGLQGVLLSSLQGGQGLGALGTLDLQTRDGSVAAVDLSAAQSLQDILSAINGSGLAIEATLNESATGIQLRDLSGGLTHAFSVSSVDATASSLGIAASTDDTVVVGTGLDLQSVSRSTSLASLNQARGVDDGSFKIKDTLGGEGAINIAVDGLKTVGQVIDAINDLGLAVEARLNETGDGILLTDTGGGNGALTVTDVGSGTAAADLRIAGSATSRIAGGQVQKVIDGAQHDTILVTATDSLDSIAQRLRDSGAFATATVVTDANGGARLDFSSRRGGDAGRLAIQTDGFDLGLQQVTRGRDAMIAVGPAGGQSQFYRSSDGVFTDAVAGLSLTLKELSDQPITIDVKADTGGVVTAAKGLVDQYNKLVDKVDKLTFFDETNQAVGLLFGSNETLRIESGFGRLFSGRIQQAGTLKSLAEVGLSLNDQGKLELDESRLTESLKQDPAAVSDFFTTEQTGLAARVDDLTERLAGVGDSLLLSKNNSLSQKIERNSQRVDQMNTRLDKERDRMLKQFYAMEAAIAKLQSNQQYIAQMQPITMDR